MAHLPNTGCRHCFPGIVSVRGDGSLPPMECHQGNRRPIRRARQGPVRSSNLLALSLSRCIRLRTMCYGRNKMWLWLHGACVAALSSFWEGHVRTWWRAILVSGARAIASKLGVSTGWVATWLQWAVPDSACGDPTSWTARFPHRCDGLWRSQWLAEICGKRKSSGVMFV